jgi:hypothetical protein
MIGNWSAKSMELRIPEVDAKNKVAFRKTDAHVAQHGKGDGKPTLP